MSSVLCLDIETTGLDVSIDEILQLSIIDTEDFVFNRFYKPNFTLSWNKSEKIHGITSDMVKHCQHFSDLSNIEKIQHILDKAEVLVGYNLSTDLEFLALYDLNFDNLVLNDVAYDFADYYGPKHSGSSWVEEKHEWKNQKLSYAAQYFGYKDFRSHNALEDAKATLFLWKKLREHGIKPVAYTFLSLIETREERQF